MYTAKHIKIGFSHEEINLANTVEIEFSRLRVDGYEMTLKYLKNYGFDVMRLDFMELQGVRGISGAIITLDSYEKSQFGQASKNNKEHRNQSLIQLDVGVQVINPFYANTKLTSLLRTDWKQEIVPRDNIL